MSLSSLLRPMASRRASVTPLAVLCIALLVGVVALLVDGGTLMEARRHVQAAADAAALAGAANLYANWPANAGNDSGQAAITSAKDAASANGFTDGNQCTVTVNTPPGTYQGGPNAGKSLPAGYIEVIIQYNASHLFSGVFGAGATPVAARAVARGRCAPFIETDLLALSLDLSGAVNVTNLLGGLKVKNCLHVNSSKSDAVKAGLLAKITAPLININLNALGLLANLLSLLLGSSTINQTLPAADPLRHLADPDATQLGSAPSPQPAQPPGPPMTITSGTVKLYPGVYTGGISIGGTATVILEANSDGSPGIYYMDGGGFQVSGSARIQMPTGVAAGIMIYNNWYDPSTDVVSFNSSGSITITPPASGLYCGLCIFQKRGAPSPSLTPAVSLSGNISLGGTIYAAHGNVSLSAKFGTNFLGGQIIADSLTTSGSVTVNIDPNGQPTANQRILGLVE